ncbi:MAG: tetratricopeptide repeat protein [Chryseolinea sp.]
MTFAFTALALLMLTTASLFIGLPLWRTASGETANTPPKRWPGIYLITALVFASIGLYAALGNPAAIDHVAAPSHAEAPNAEPQDKPQEADVNQAQIEGMVARLAQRLQTQPNDPAGWRMLAKSYETLGRFDQAVQAYQKLLSLSPPDADVLTDYAVTLGMSKGQTLAGEPEAVINQALKLNPKHIQALALSGSAAFEERDYKRAAAQWQKLLALIPPDADMRASIERNVEKAKALGG